MRLVWPPPPQALVYRNGELQELDAVELVPGDVLQLRVGDRVPADSRLIRLEAGVCVLLCGCAPAPPLAAAPLAAAPVVWLNMLFCAVEGVVCGVAANASRLCVSVAMPTRRPLTPPCPCCPLFPVCAATLKVEQASLTGESESVMKDTVA